MIDTTTTVRNLVVQYPQTLLVFEKHGIDYCCGGGKCLAEAAAEERVELETLAADLDEAIAAPPREEASARNWSSVSLAELMDYIVDKHHAYTKAQLPRLETMMNAVVNAHGPRHGSVLVPLQQNYEGLKTDIEAHLTREEDVLFPGIRQLEFKEPGASDGLGDVMAETAAEHETVGAILDGMRVMTADYELPGDACPTYGGLYRGLAEMEKDLHRHIHLENNILFPRASALLAGR